MFRISLPRFCDGWSEILCPLSGCTILGAFFHFLQSSTQPLQFVFRFLNTSYRSFFNYDTKIVLILILCKCFVKKVSKIIHFFDAFYHFLFVYSNFSTTFVVLNSYNEGAEVAPTRCIFCAYTYLISAVLHPVPLP